MRWSDASNFINSRDYKGLKELLKGEVHADEMLVVACRACARSQLADEVLPEAIEERKDLILDQTRARIREASG